MTPDVRIMLCTMQGGPTIYYSTLPLAYGSNEEFVRARTKFSTTAVVLVLECTPTVGTGSY